MAGSAANKTTNLLSEDFNHEVVKERFYKKLDEYYKSCVALTKKMTKQMVEETKASLIDIEKQKESNAGEFKLTDEQYKMTYKYEIYREGHDTYLIKKRVKPDDPIVKYIPYEDTFDLLAQIHVSNGHGGRLFMYKEVRKDYMIPSPQIDCILLCCNVCNSDTKLTTSLTSCELKNVVQLDIINMEDSPDGLFQYLLIYVFKRSSYTLLRPLMKKCPIEISMELLKIFLDFGPPNQFEVHTKDKDLFHSSVVHLRDVCSKSIIPVYDTMVDGFNCTVRVLRSMQKWMRESGSCNWGFSCHMLQWKLNNFKNKDKQTPYSLLFGSTPHYSNVDSEFQISDSEQMNNETEEPENILEQNDIQIGSTLVMSDDDDEEVDISESDEDDPLRFIPPVIEDSLPKPVETSEESTSTAVPSLPTIDTTERPICYVCQCKIFKVYNCCQCQNPMHIFCSTRLEGASPNTPSFICTTCNMNAE